MWGVPHPFFSCSIISWWNINQLIYPPCHSIWWVINQGPNRLDHWPSKWALAVDALWLIIFPMFRKILKRRNFTFFVFFFLRKGETSLISTNFCAFCRYLPIVQNFSLWCIELSFHFKYIIPLNIVVKLNKNKKKKEKND
jgi:hypothetical protein